MSSSLMALKLQRPAMHCWCGFRCAGAEGSRASAATRGCALKAASRRLIPKPIVTLRQTRPRRIALNITNLPELLKPAHWQLLARLRASRCCPKFRGR